MRRALPELLLAVACSALLLTVGGLTPAFTDYEEEAQPAIEALLRGDVGRFLEGLPAYGGSVVLRAPFALLADALGGGDLAVFRALAVPALLAAAVLAAVQAVRLRERGRPRAQRLLLVLLVALNPLTMRALDVGHPEELLVGVLCVAAVLLALADRPVWATVALGVAIGAKPWALVALAPVLLALPPGRVRVAAAAGAGAVATLVFAPVLLGRAGAELTVAVARDSGTIFQPWQVLWFFGDPTTSVLGADALVKEGYRAAPAWAAGSTKALVVGVCALVSLLAWRRRVPRERALVLLAAVLLLRCLLDTWNTDYYAVPFLLALVVWETRTHDRLPVLSVVATGAAYATTYDLRYDVSPDALAALYLAWSVPLAGALVWLSSRTAASTSAAPTSWPWTTSPGARTSTNGVGPSPTRFLSRAVARTTASASTPSIEVGSPAAASSASTSSRSAP